MTNNMLKETPPVDTRQRNATGKSWTLGLTSLFFILLQSACTGLHGAEWPSTCHWARFFGRCDSGYKSARLDPWHGDPYPDGDGCSCGVSDKPLRNLASTIVALKA